jgi:hypothetical protein
VPGSALIETFQGQLLGNPPSQNFYSYDSGTVGLAGTTYTVNVAVSGGLGTPQVTMTACSALSTGGACNGTTTRIGVWSVASSGTSIATAAVPMAEFSRLSVQTSITGFAVLGGTVTVTINTGVDPFASPRQIRAATITNA